MALTGIKGFQVLQIGDNNFAGPRFDPDAEPVGVVNNPKIYICFSPLWLNLTTLSGAIQSIELICLLGYSALVITTELMKTFLIRVAWFVEVGS